MAAINVSGSTATNLYGPGEYETFTPEDIKTRIYGSKVVILLEQAMLICTYLTKACMLLLYNRLASRLPHQFAIKLIAGYSLMGFIATEMAWFLNCRPLSGYWALPVPDRMFSPLRLSFPLTRFNPHSTMRNLHTLCHRASSLQPQLGPDDACGWNPAPDESESRHEKESDPSWDLQSRFVRRARRGTEQILQLQQSHDNNLHALVHPRVFDRNLRLQRSDALAAGPARF